MIEIGYVNVFVANFQASHDFFTKVVGLECRTADAEFGYASFDAGPISFAIAQTDDTNLVGRHTGVGFMTQDIKAEYQRLQALGVVFEMPPTQQPWGGTFALFKDPDGNIYYLDSGH